MHNFPPTFIPPECLDSQEFSEGHLQTCEETLRSSGPMEISPSPVSPSWAAVLGAPGCHSIDQQAQGSTSLTLSGCLPTISCSFWTIFLQDQQLAPIPSRVVSRSPC